MWFRRNFFSFPKKLYECFRLIVTNQDVVNRFDHNQNSSDTINKTNVCENSNEKLLRIINKSQIVKNCCKIKPIIKIDHYSKYVDITNKSIHIFWKCNYWCVLPMNITFADNDVICKNQSKTLHAFGHFHVKCRTTLMHLTINDTIIQYCNNL